MSRPIRITYPGAWYHVMNRGRRREKIFHEAADYNEFIRVLQEASSQFSLHVSAYCLMPNHYHLLVQTPHGNLSRCMRHVNGVYTQRFNRFHDCEGQLFRGRYKAVLVENNEYLLHVMRYIHRNPLEANMVRRLEDFSWSSHHGYISQAKRWDWLHKNFILDILTDKKSRRQQEYFSFVSLSNSTEIDHFYSLKNLPAMLGSVLFQEKVKNKYNGLLFDREVSIGKELVFSSERILAVVKEYFSITEEQLFAVKRGTSNPARDISMYLLKKYRQDTLNEIGSVLGIKHYSTVSNGIIRAKKGIENGDLAKDIHELEKVIEKSQGKT